MAATAFVCWFVRHFRPASVCVCGQRGQRDARRELRPGSCNLRPLQISKGAARESPQFVRCFLPRFLTYDAPRPKATSEPATFPDSCCPTLYSSRAHGVSGRMAIVLCLMIELYWIFDSDSSSSLCVCVCVLIFFVAAHLIPLTRADSLEQSRRIIPSALGACDHHSIRSSERSLQAPSRTHTHARQWTGDSLLAIRASTLIAPAPTPANSQMNSPQLRLQLKTRQHSFMLTFAL